MLYTCWFSDFNPNNKRVKLNSNREILIDFIFLNVRFKMNLKLLKGNAYVLVDIPATTNK